MLKQNIIKGSCSHKFFPIWIDKIRWDNSGKQKRRIVVDYTKFNEITVNDEFPFPNVENILDKLSKVDYFLTIDLAQWFRQDLMEGKDQKKTAFSIPFGHYEFIHMPFRLKISFFYLSICD